MKQERGLTLLEIAVVVAVLFILAAIFLPSLLTREPARALRIECVNNLKQDGLAFRIWEGDHGNRYPMSEHETNGGTLDFTTGPNEFRHFQIMSNELETPKVLICPEESDRNRFCATNFINVGNSNLSYFVGVDATENYPSMILSGDHNITNGIAIRNGLLELTTNRLAGWTAEMHNKIGNLLLADGSVQEVDTSGLRKVLASTGVETNRLQMPVLEP